MFNDAMLDLLLDKGFGYSSSGSPLLAPVDALVTVDKQDAAALGQIGIRTVFDLANSRVFLDAQRISLAPKPVDEDGQLNAEVDLLIDNARWNPDAALPLQDVAVLQVVDAAAADILRDQLALRTIAAVATYRGFEAARIVTSLQRQFDGERDPATPDELRPMARTYATEQLDYRRCFIDFPQDHPTDRSLEDGPVSLGDGRKLLFSKPVTGTVLDMKQTWTPFGLSLGQLLHSTGLAPAESVRVAVVHWGRKERSSVDETSSQDEDIAANTEQSRAIAEVQEGVTTEMQKGSTTASQESTTKGKTGTAGAALNLGGLGSVGGGGSVSSSSTTAAATSVSVSAGQRSMRAEASQDLQAKTQQSATAVRNLRASRVVEVEQSEKEEIETRLVVNYNHSHALSIHYYEVVQIYKVEARIWRSRPCLFVPFDTDSDIFSSADGKRLTSLLPTEGSAPTAFLPEDGSIQSMEVTVGAEGATIRDLRLFDAGGKRVYSITPQKRGQTWSRVVFDLSTASLDDVAKISVRIDAPPDLDTGRTTVRVFSSSNVLTVETDRAPLVQLPDEQVNDVQIMTILDLISIGKTSSSSLFDVETKIAALSFAPSSVFARLFGAMSYRGTPLLRQVDPQPVAVYGNMIAFEMIGEDPTDRPPAVERFEPDDEIQSRVVSMIRRSEPLFDNLFDLEGSVRNGRPVARVGLMVPRRSTETLKNWMAEFDLLRDEEPAAPKAVRTIEDRAMVPPSFVALPTAGVFTEAVLGRFNASEKIDLTRFWDWQESPIPQYAPEISPVVSGSRATDADTRSAQAPNPSINIQAAPALPGFSGASGMVGALSAPSPFRDMSGRDVVGQLIEAGLASATSVSDQSANLTANSVNAATAMEIEKTRAMRDIAVAYLTGGTGGGSSDSNTRLGGMLNKGRELDARRASAGAAIKSAPQGSSSGQDSTDPDETGGGGGTGGEGGQSSEQAVFDKESNPVGHAVKATAEAQKAAEDAANKATKKRVAPPAGYVRWLGPSELLLYNFKVGSLTPELHPDHIEAIWAASKQIGGVADIASIEGRASKTKSREGDPDEKNEDLSIARMELVWQALMEFAFDSQSNLQKQRYLSDRDPVRAKYSALSNISSGEGDEDPVERSVLVRLNRQVEPKPRPIPVPDVPGINCIGHTVVIGQLNLVYQDNRVVTKIVQGNGIIAERGVEIGDNIDLSSDDRSYTVQNVDNDHGIIQLGNEDSDAEIRVELEKTEPGKKSGVTVDHKVTTRWHVDISNPRASGVSSDELIVQLETIISALDASNETLPTLGGSIGVPGIGEVSLEGFNLNDTISTLSSKLFGAVTHPNSTVGKTLRGLMQGTVEVDVAIYARPEADPDRTDLWVRKDFKLSGSGLYYARAFENPGVTTEGVAKFDYETNGAHRLSDWGLSSQLDSARLNFSKGSVPGDVADLIAFLKQLIELFGIPGFGGVLDQAVAGVRNVLEAVEAARDLISGTTELFFELEGEVGHSTDEIDVGRSITAFSLSTGTLRLK